MYHIALFVVVAVVGVARCGFLYVFVAHSFAAHAGSPQARHHHLNYARLSPVTCGGRRVSCASKEGAFVCAKHNETLFVLLFLVLYFCHFSLNFSWGDVSHFWLSFRSFFAFVQNGGCQHTQQQVYPHLLSRKHLDRKLDKAFSAPS